MLEEWQRQVVDYYAEDKVHGRIVLKGGFAKLVRTPEFVRMKKITQTGFSFLDYPNLFQENRFDHSIGSFHLTSKIIERLRSILKKKGIEIPQSKIDIALCAMLLHDIGHGPFSHCFEKVTEYSHERLTRDIIIGKTEVNQVLKDFFGDDAPFEVAGFISVLDTEKVPKDSFTKLFKSLISHQVDSDRLDYLVRDAYHAGIKSAIDITKIINALNVVVNENGEYELIVDKSNFSLFETVIVERNQRYRDVYFTLGSDVMDYLFPIILSLCRKHYNELDLLSNIPKFKPAMTKLILAQKELDMYDILALSERMIFELFEYLTTRSDVNEMMAYFAGIACEQSTFNKERRIVIDDMHITDKIKFEINEKFGDVCPANAISIFEISSSTKLYKPSEGLKINCGTCVKDISEVSGLITANSVLTKKATVVLLDTLVMEMGVAKNDRPEAIKQIQYIISKLQKKEEEFELKYILNEYIKMDEVIEVLCDNGFLLSNIIKKPNIDMYYDTKNRDLLKSGRTLRIRRVIREDREEYKYTYKEPICAGTLYSSRTEIEGKLRDIHYQELYDIMEEKNCIKDLDNIESDPKLLVNNSRKDYHFIYDGAEVCVSYDNAKYTNPANKKSVNGLMLEIEAIGNINERVILNMISEIMKQHFDNRISLTQINKYRYGIEHTN